MSENELAKSRELGSLRGCPYCKGELEKGYVISGHSLRWDSKKHMHWAPRTELLTPVLPWTLINLPALRCKQCKIIICNYEG